MADLEESLKRARVAAETDLEDGVWFKLEEQVDLATQGEYGGIRQVYRAGLGEIPKNIKKAQLLNFDLGIGDPVTPEPSANKTASLILKEDLTWFVYPIETIVSEKIHAIIARGEANSRSKDVYDLSKFLLLCDTKTLVSALKNTFEYRATELPENLSQFLSAMDTSVLERGWKSATKSVVDKPDFRECLEAVIDQIAKLESKL